MKLSVILSFFVMFIFSCAKDELPEKINLFGKVIDQVTKQPVSGATIFLAGLPFNEEGIELRESSPQSTSDMDGIYSFSVLKSDFSEEQIKNSLLYPYIYAEKYGYAGSSYHPVLYNYDNTVELYHPSKMVLRIWNDTLSNTVDEVELGIVADSYRSYPDAIGRMVMCTPITRKKCSGRDFDTIFEFHPLWGNMSYELHFNTWCHSVAKFTIKPDSILYFSISF